MHLHGKGNCNTSQVHNIRRSTEKLLEWIPDRLKVIVVSFVAVCPLFFFYYGRFKLTLKMFIKSCPDLRALLLLLLFLNLEIAGMTVAVIYELQAL